MVDQNDRHVFRVYFDHRGQKVFNVYRNGNRDLVVLSTGSAIPGPYSANTWRKSRRRILKVSDEIRSTVQRQGYYVRSLRVTKKGII